MSTTLPANRERICGARFRRWHPPVVSQQCVAGGRLRISRARSRLGGRRKATTTVLGHYQNFEKLAQRFEVGTLKNFGSWAKFVECSQRRNVITHCDGIASRQYVDICKSQGVKFIEPVVVGQKLSISQEYLSDAIEIVTEVGLKLGQVLWRSSKDHSIQAADWHLGQTIFELLKREEWQLALRMGEFGQECSKRSQRQPRNERAAKIILVNHAQAAKWSGDNVTAMAIINGFDWSGSGLEFRLAVECLNDDWDGAAATMAQIGPSSEDMPVHGYVGWPIFRVFRTTDQFSSTFRNIFGVEFTEKVQEASEQSTESRPPPDVEPEGEDDASGSD